MKLTSIKIFNKTFHLYIDNAYSSDLIKYLIYPVYKNIYDIKPYINQSNLKHIKNSFNHGDLVYTGNNHFILKNVKKGSKKWKKCEYSIENEANIFIPFEYIQSRGFEYYISINRYFTIAPLSLDILNNEIFDFKNKRIESNVVDIYDDPEMAQYYLETADTDEPPIDIKSDVDVISSYFGELVVKDDILHVHLTEKDTMPLINNNIAPHFIKAKGFSYYFEIASEFSYNLKTLISPLEILNLNTMEIEKIKIE